MEKESGVGSVEEGDCTVNGRNDGGGTGWTGWAGCERQTGDTQARLRGRAVQSGVLRGGAGCRAAGPEKEG